MDRVLALVITLAVGGLVAFQAPANNLLSRHVGDLGAAFTSLLLSTVIVGVLLVAAGHAGELRGLGDYRPEYALGAISGAAIVLVSLITVRELGATGVAALLVAGQLIVSVALDRAGVLGLETASISLTRMAGVALLIAGTVMVTSR
jgi:transporter family-2 protein